MKEWTELNGLEGNNPFEFFAALGVQVAFDFLDEQPMLWWSDEIVPRPRTEVEFSIDRIAAQVKHRLSECLQSPGLNPRTEAGEKMDGGSTLKLSKKDLRTFLEQAQQDKYMGNFYMSLVAEGSLANNGKSKPTDFYFTAGQQKFLAIVHETISNVTIDEIKIALTNGGRKPLRQSTLKLDARDDPVYALTSEDPSKVDKFVNRGIEALTILGLSRFPVYGKRGRTLTSGCSGKWHSGTFSWPIWEQPATTNMVRSLLAASTPYDEARSKLVASCSILKIYTSNIIRSSQGGYGTFKPAEIVWQQAKSRAARLTDRQSRGIELLGRLSAEARENGMEEEELTELLKFEY